MEPLFVEAKIIGSPGKNDSLFFIQKCLSVILTTTKFWVWLWLLRSCCVWQRTNQFV